MTLALDLAVRRGTLDLAVALTVEPGELVALLGPNGAGKSTVLRAVAGLLPIDRGSISIDGVTVDDGDTVFVPPENRPVSVVFQDYLLFAHLSALENVAFGLRARGVAKHPARARARDWLERLGLGDFADHRPGELSGGQAQRIALARALVTDPAVLLLDEPLAALDAGARRELRRELRHHLDSFPGMRLMVTHDPVDAYALADRVVVLEHGEVVQAGSLADITAQPRSRYVADLVGLNLVTGHAVGGVLTTADGGQVVTAERWFAGPAFVAFRPQAVTVHRRQPEGSARNVWATTIGSIDPHVDRVRLRLSGAVPLIAEITPAALAELAVRPGDTVWASVKATETEIYPR